MVLIDPLDYKILEAIEVEEGTVMGGVVPLVTTVKAMRARKDSKLNILTPDKISARLRAMSSYGLVVKVKLSQRNNGWQRTKKGLAILDNWKGVA